MPVALNGLVPVKVNTENGAIARGDLLTSSSTPGVAMKATGAGMVIGQAIAPYDGSGEGKIMMFVNPFFYSPGLMPSAEGGIVIQGGTASTMVETSADQAAFVINQNGAGDLLQMQASGIARLLVKNDGTVQINSATSALTDNVVVVKNNDAEIFTINARGDVAIQGVIRINNEQFAGSIKTDNNGEASVAFDYDLGTGKPVVELTVEGDMPTLAQVKNFSTDATGNYIGFSIKTFTPSGSNMSASVHYLVIAKPLGYATKDVVITVVSSPSEVIPPPSGGSGGGGGETTDTTPLADTTPPVDTITPPDTIIVEPPQAVAGDTTSTDTTPPPDTTPTDTMLPADTTTTIPEPTVDITPPADTVPSADTSQVPGP